MLLAVVWTVWCHRPNKQERLPFSFSFAQPLSVALCGVVLNPDRPALSPKTVTETVRLTRDEPRMNTAILALSPKPCRKTVTETETESETESETETVTETETETETDTETASKTKTKTKTKTTTKTKAKAKTKTNAKTKTKTKTKATTTPASY